MPFFRSCSISVRSAISALRRLLQHKLFYVPLLTVVVLGLALSWMGWDLKFQDLFWDPVAGKWKGRQVPIFGFLYQYGVIPALFVGLGSLFLLVLSFPLRPLCKFRRIFLYLFLILALGSGLITNGILKEFWGRPRPSQLKSYGGIQSYEPILYYNPASFGKSFPCGHATMGFYFFGVALLFRKRVRAALLVAALVFGMVMGLARNSYGGHFLTDVLWAGLIMWMTAFGLYQVMGLRENIFCSSPSSRNREPTLARKAVDFVIFASFVLALGTIALATPIDKSSRIPLPSTNSFPQGIQFSLRGNVVVIPDSDRMDMVTRGIGFGFPKSHLHIVVDPHPSAGGCYLRHQIQGFFTKLTVTTELHLQKHRQYDLFFAGDDLGTVSLDGQCLEAGRWIHLNL